MRREDHYSNDEAGAAYWADHLGREEYIDDRPTRAELKAEDRDAEDYARLSRVAAGVDAAWRNR